MPPPGAAIANSRHVHAQHLHFSVQPRTYTPGSNELNPHMTVGELIDRLSACDRSAKVHLAINPFFPMAHQVAEVIEAQDESGAPVVFIAEDAEGEQHGHLPPDVAVRLTWQEPVEAPQRRRRSTIRPVDNGQ